MGDEKRSASGDEERSRLHFHYSRAKRLEGASDVVRELNDNPRGSRPGLLKTLLPNRASAFLFLAIIMLASTMLVTRLLDRMDSSRLAGMVLSARAIAVDETIHLIVTKTNPERRVPPGVVTLSIQGQPDGPSLVREILFTHEERQQYRVSFEASSESLILLFATAEEHLVLRTKVIRPED